MMIHAGLTAIAGLVLAQGLAFAQDAPRLPCPAADKPCLRKALQAHPVRRIESWRSELQRPLDSRIGPAPAPLVEYLTMDNMAQGFPQRPTAALLEPGFAADVKAAIAELPPQVWRLFGDRLAGIYFVDNLGGTGYTDAVFDRSGKPVAGYLVLDATVLRPLTANQWASWKEGTPFKPQDGYRLAARIEADADDNRKNAIQYILLHELGHVLSIGSNLHPPWTIEPRQVPERPYPFMDLSWTVDRRANRYDALSDAAFPQRRQVAYYFGAKLAASEMVPIYTSLEQTNFPTLYAATRPGDDFAESFASYVHVVLQRRPWQVTLFKGGETAKAVGSCWEEPRCAAKRRLLERLFDR